jgi:hypothetical protein
VTDPFDDRAFNLPVPNYSGGELADRCENLVGDVVEGGYALPRIFSNQAAASGDDPCVPPSGTFYGVAPTTMLGPIVLDRGQTSTTTWEVFATASVGVIDYAVAALDPDVTAAAFDPCTSSPCTGYPGDLTTLSLSLSPTATRGWHEADVFIPSSGAVWQVRIWNPPEMCDLVLQNCPSGETCRPDLTYDATNALVADGVCGVPGSAHEGEACSADTDCAVGVCEDGACHSYCAVCDLTTNTCPDLNQASADHCPPSSYCTVGEFLSGNHLFAARCAPGCDPFSPTSCASGSCYMAYGGPICSRTGAMPVGGACTYNDDCVAGDACFDGECWPLCHVSGTDCTGTCLDVRDAALPGVGVCQTSCTLFASSCPTGEKCVQTLAGGRCFGAGTDAAGATCSNDGLHDSCATTLVCDRSTCVTPCGSCDPTNGCDYFGRDQATVDHCASSTYCTGTTTDGAAEICEPACDLANPSSCTTPDGQAGACYLFEGGPTCWTIAGTIATGNTCVYANDCVPGDICDGGTCHPLCFTATPACTSGTCTDLADPADPGVGACR